jgi:hypothetical protein
VRNDSSAIVPHARWRTGRLSRWLSREVMVVLDVLSTRIDPHGESFRRNRDANLGLLAQLDEQLAAARAGGGA